MSDNNQQGFVPITVNAQYIKDFSFRNAGAPKTLVNLKEAPQVNIAVDVKAQKFNEEIFEVALALKADAKSGNETVFTIDLTYAGLFTVKVQNAQHLQPLLLVECPRILFPFARAIVAEISREGGFAPLLVHPIDFAALYRAQGQQPQAAGARPNA